MIGNESLKQLAATPTEIAPLTIIKKFRPTQILSNKPNLFELPTSREEAEYSPTPGEALEGSENKSSGGGNGNGNGEWRRRYYDLAETRQVR